MIRTAILGASGYVGGELLRLIAAHPELAPAKLYGESKAGQTIAATHPHLAAAYPDVSFERFDGDLDGIDLVFAALPHGHSQKLAASILAAGVPFVDLERRSCLAISSTASPNRTATLYGPRKPLPPPVAMRQRRSLR